MTTDSLIITLFELCHELHISAKLKDNLLT